MLIKPLPFNLNNLFRIFAKMNSEQPNNPLHGITLEAILKYLVNFYGWKKLGEEVRINSFLHEPSINSSLKFLRKTPWARKKVEELYVFTRIREE